MADLMDKDWFFFPLLAVGLIVVTVFCLYVAGGVMEWREGRRRVGPKEGTDS